MSGPSDPIARLEPDEILDWAGKTTFSRGKGYQREGRVTDLVRGPGGSILATVEGTRPYRTGVRYRNGLESSCTCPVGVSCKHAVAVILEYQSLINKQTEIPEPEDEDLLPEDYADLFPDGPDRAEIDTAGWSTAIHGRKKKQERAKSQNLRIQKYLVTLPKEDLIAILEELAGEIPEVRQDLVDRLSVATSDTPALLRSLTADINRISRMEAWSNPWNNESSIPDYSPVRKRMEILLSMKKYDDLLKAGDLLLKKGREQVESSDDEGETAGEIGECMDIVFAALGQSDRPVHERLLFAIRAVLDDEFDLCSGADTFLTRKWPKAAWSLVADELLTSLSAREIPVADTNYHEMYLRDNLTSWIITTLDKAGRAEEATDLARAEAPITASYVRLVRRLIRLGNEDEAALRIREGVEALGRKSPGIVRQLLDIRREMHEKGGDLRSAAGLLAEEFLRDPSFDSFSRLRTAAEKAGVWDVAEGQVVRYLTMGLAPAADRDTPAEIFGIFPISGLIDPGSWKSPRAPFYAILIQRAIADHQPEEAVMWYDRCILEQRKPCGDLYLESRLWEAVKDRFPDRALAYWRGCADRQVQSASPKGYELALTNLEKIRALLLKEGRSDEWEEYVTRLRQEHARKKKFIGMLDGIGNRRRSKS